MCRSFAETDGHPEFFYYLLADGGLYRSTSWDRLTGDLVATLAPSYYQNPTKLTDAQYLFGDPTELDWFFAGGSDAAGNRDVIKHQRTGEVTTGI